MPPSVRARSTTPGSRPPRTRHGQIVDFVPTTGRRRAAQSMVMDVLETAPLHLPPYFDSNGSRSSPISKTRCYSDPRRSYGRVLERGNCSVLSRRRVFLRYYDHDSRSRPHLSHILEIALEKLAPSKNEDFTGVPEHHPALDICRAHRDRPGRITERREEGNRQRRLERRCRSTQVRPRSCRRGDITQAGGREARRARRAAARSSYRLAFWPCRGVNQLRRFFDVTISPPSEWNCRSFRRAHKLLLRSHSAAPSASAIDHPTPLFTEGVFREIAATLRSGARHPLPNDGRPSISWSRKFYRATKRSGKIGRSTARPVTNSRNCSRTSWWTHLRSRRSRRRSSGSSAIRCISVIWFTRRSASSCASRWRTP